MDGTQAAEIILKQRDLPLIFLSSHTNPEVVEKTEGITSYGYIVKSSVNTVLIASIKMAFRLFEARREERLKRESTILRPAESSFPKIFKTSPNPITIIRLSDGIFLDVNESYFTRVTGYPRAGNCWSAVLSGHPDIWIHRKDRVRVVAALKKTGEVHGVEALFRGKGGKTIYGLISARALEINGESCVVGIVNDITEQKRVEEALRQTQKQLKIIFDTVPALIWQKGLDEKYVTVNKAYGHTFGLSEGDVTGKTDQDLFPAEIAARFVAGDRKVLSTGISELGIEEQIQKGSGERGWNLTNRMVYYDEEGRVAGTIGFALDITERKQAEMALRDSEERHRIIIQTAMDGFWMVDLGGRLLEVNEAYCRMSGYSYQELLAMNIADLDANETKNEITAHIRQIRSQGESRFETRHRRKDRSIFDVEVSSKYRPTYGGGFEIFLRDITDRKQSEIALKKSKDRLRALSAHIQSVREEERANIAREIHDDLGQILTGLKMDLSWILRHTDPNQSELKEKAQAMGQLIDQTVKTVRRISTELRPRILDDFGLVAALEWQAEEFTKKTGITCSFRSTSQGLELKPDLSIAVFRIFQEALTNVVRHSGATKVEASLKKDAQDLLLTIRDNGRGISDVAIAQSNSLGLVGMRERALILGGTIEIKGKKGKGTSVILRLPVSKS